MTERTAPPAPARGTVGSTQALLLLLIYVAFVSLGLPDGLLGAAWPQMRADFSAALNANAPILFLATLGGMTSGFLSGWILRRLGVGRVLVLNTFLTSFAILGFAFSPGLASLAVLSFFLGLGNGAIDAGLNNFVANHLSSRHMNWLHAFWGVGVSLGTLVISGIFAANGSWRTAYQIIGLFQAALGVAFLLNLSSLQSPGDAQTPGRTEPHPPFLATLALPAAWASLALFFAYCGVEFGTGIWIASLLHDGRGWSMESAGLMVSLYWCSLTAGRFLIGTISNRTTPLRIVRWALFGAIAGTSLIALSSLSSLPTGAAGSITGLGLLVTGLSLAPIFPMLMHDTPRLVGRDHAMNLMGFQSAIANLGVAAMPSAIGVVLRWQSTEALGPLLLTIALTMAGLLALRESGLAR
jgi:fucose permease